VEPRVRIRAFGEGDIAQVARLHESVFQPIDRTPRLGDDAHHAYFRRVFIENPSRDDALPSLVAEEPERHIAGFLGVVPRRMALNRQRIQAAISCQLLVEPGRHAALIAVQLARTFLSGPQDLSISDEASDLSRKLWEGLGGTTALLRSLHWTRPLRPARLAVSVMRRRASLAPIAAVASPASRMIDAVATRLPCSYFYQSKPCDAIHDDECEALLVQHPDLCGAGSLHPDYDDHTFAWLLQRAKQRVAGGRLHAAVIMDGSAVGGWYLYWLDKGGTADVLHIAATPPAIDQVIDHLFHHAWLHGAIAATGRVEPRFLQNFSDKYCFFHRRGPWMLVNSHRPELVRCFQAGDACFSRLDGEWCLGF